MRWALVTIVLAPACDLVYNLERPPAVADGIASRLVEQRSWVTTGTSIEIDSDIFAADRDYVMAVASVYAWSEAANGDFRTPRWPAPVATATNYSGVFTVSR